MTYWVIGIGIWLLLLASAWMFIAGATREVPKKSWRKVA